MKCIRLDFERKDVPLPRAGLLVLLVALATTVALGDHYLTMRKRLADWELAADQLEHSARRHGIAVHREPQEGDRNEEVRHANDVLRQLTLPWDQLFESIEAAGSTDVALLALAPDRDKRLVRIGIEAKNATAGLGYLRSLENQEVFQSVQLQNHQVQLQDPEKPIRFNLQATWKGLP